MNKTSIIALSALTFIFAETVSAKSGVYVAGAFGASEQVGMPNQSEVPGATEDSTNPFSGLISVGYNYDWCSLLGIGAEIGWGHYASTNYGTGKMASSAWDAMVVGNFSPSMRYSFIAKAGFAREQLTVPNTSDSVAINPIIGLGVGYNLSESTQIHLDYVRIFGDETVQLTDDSSTPIINSLMIGLKHTF